MKRSRKREFAFLLHDTARLLRTRADQRVRALGMTRAQWAVLSRLERSQGLKQAELAEALDIQPITLTRLVDRLCAAGLVERRADPLDRRAKRLFLTPAARPVMERLAQLGEAMMTDALRGIDDAVLAQMLGHLTQVMDNLRAGAAEAAPERIARAEPAHG